MNLILLFEQDFTDAASVTLRDRRFEHLTSVHKVRVGDQLTVGLLNGQIGTGEVLALDEKTIRLHVNLTTAPPTPLPLTLVLALPRPNMLKRSLQTCATMGVKKIILLHSARVEKNYWQSPQLKEETIREHLLLGLEQAKDTVLPTVSMEKNYQAFIDNTLTALCQTSQAYVAHPKATRACPTHIKTATTLLIGPEGGFIDTEIQQFHSLGCQSITLGERILRVETAVPALLAKLFL